MKKLAILGKLSTKFNAPFNDNDYQIWAFNIHTDEKRLKRVDLWFDIHSRGFNPKATITRQNFPFKECEELVGGQYFNNSVSYLIAYAILQGYREIELYGMRFNAGFEAKRDGEYQNVRELIFFAKGLGVKITAPCDDLLKEYPVYGV